MIIKRNYNAAADLIDRNVEEGRGKKLAYIDPFRSLSYWDLQQQAARVGPMLDRYGVERENRVALAMLDTVEFPILFWGAIRAGIVPVPFNTRLTVEQYRYLLEDSRAKVVIASPPLLRDIEEAASTVPGIRAIIVAGGGAPGYPRLDRLIAAESPVQPADTCAEEVAFWLYSSGTTGAPKGVMHVHATPRLAAHHVGLRGISPRESDVIFSAAKMFFSYGIANSGFCPLSVGATTVLYPERPTAQTVFEMLHAYEVTVFYGVPTLYASILSDLRCTPESGSAHLRLCVSAGEPLPPAIGKAWRSRFGLDIVNGVGSTEMGYLFLTNLPEHVEYGTAGLPVDGYRVRLVDKHHRDVRDGQIGELLVSAPTAAVGYWHQREKTRHTFLGEWIRTGDRYLRRSDGVYVYCGRGDDMFKVSGIWVSPIEIEDALLSHSRVLEAAVIAVEDKDGLVKPKAFVVLRQGTDAALLGRSLYEELKVHVKHAIGPWKYPRSIEFLPSLPRTTTGKLQRYKLRELAAAHGERPLSTPDLGPHEATPEPAAGNHP